MRKASIGVRCARAHSCLWFHLSKNFTTDDDRHEYLKAPYSFMTGEEIRLAHVTTQDMHRLTDVGRRIAIRVLLLPGVKELGPRLDNFYLELRDDFDESHWAELLPMVIEIIRQEMNKKATVRVEPGSDNRVEQWHEPLLRKLNLIG